jgi:hypothetical protein
VVNDGRQLDVIAAWEYEVVHGFRPREALDR